MENQNLLTEPDDNSNVRVINVHEMGVAGTYILEGLLVKANKLNQDLKDFIYSLTLDMQHDSLAHENGNDCKLCVAENFLKN